MARRPLDLANKKFGRLLAISSRYDGKRRMWKCLCDCGNECEIDASKLNTGHTKSCGCLHKESISTHGSTNSPEHAAWLAMKSRCNCNSNRGYKYYGGRGIKVCEKWSQSFEAFLSDMGQKPSASHSIERIDVNGNYEPSNCVWADIETQKRNRRNTNLITYKGVIKTLTEHAEDNGLNSGTVWVRINKLGWSVEDALTKPSRLAKSKEQVA